MTSSDEDNEKDKKTAPHINRKSDGIEDAAGLSVPSKVEKAAASVTQDTFAREKLGRYMVAIVAAFLGLMAALCIGLALYTGAHFLSNAEAAAQKAETKETIDYIISQINRNNATLPCDPCSLSGANAGEKEKSRYVKSSDSMQLLAPLIPATFSTTLGIILIITLTRFVSSYVSQSKKEEEKELNYGAIATLVKEVSETISKMRGK